jgi:hypothetical protein
MLLQRNPKSRAETGDAAERAQLDARGGEGFQDLVVAQHRHFQAPFLSVQGFEALSITRVTT